MKILAINYRDIAQTGGINTSIQRVFEELIKRGHECTILSVNPGSLPDEENINGIKVIRIKSPTSRHLYGLSIFIARFLRKNLGKSLNPDIVHIHEYRSLLTLEAACILRYKRLPFVFSPHYAHDEHNTLAGKYLIRYYKPLGIRAFKWAAAIVTNSEYSKNTLVADFSLPPDKIRVIPHGVDNPETPLKKAENSKGQAITLLYAGVLIEKKGVQYIIRAVAELKERGIRPRLVIIGEGDYKRRLENLAASLDVQDYISWAGYLPRQKLQSKLTEADIFLLLSRSESYGITVAEALATGTPCIVAKTTALTEFLSEPGCSGIDYPPDSTVLADLILKIRNEGIRAGPFSDKIKTWSEVSADYEILYEDIAGQAAKKNTAESVDKVA